MVARMRPTPLTLCLLVAACAVPTGRDLAVEPIPPMDPHSHARPAEVQVSHVSLDLAADFVARRLAGTATVRVHRRDPAAPLRLDSDGLEISSVEAGGVETTWHAEPSDPVLGAPIVVELPAGADEVVLHYRTRPDASALQWLDPAQTDGGEKPYLFTQGQAILTRSWIPLQDSPGVRITYDATIRVDPKLGVVPVMSASERDVLGGGAFRFVMDKPVPPYLIALAIGEIESRDVSSRCAIWSEPGVVDRAAAELADTEQMIETCEGLFGPYRWGRYDVLILPPAFPFGGMENPCMTFATPTILAGDKSLVALIAHELAHSWSGNLVTNATWRDFWLNEGFTVYLEQRIVEAIYGPERARMETLLGLRQLAKELRELPKRDQRLHIDLTDRNPDDGMTSVPYDKGAAFLRRLEQAFGRERFDAFLESWFDDHAFQSVTTDEFLDYLDEHLLAGDDHGIEV
ncbi:MAG: aminopeptidase, partial [Planctomycetes bacterium]|nr:aminopeptidase [Planctomycetota bacterium]